MNLVVVYLCIFPAFVLFSPVSEGSETHVITAEIKRLCVLVG